MTTRKPAIQVILGVLLLNLLLVRVGSAAANQEEGTSTLVTEVRLHASWAPPYGFLKIGGLPLMLHALPWHMRCIAPIAAALSEDRVRQ